MSESELALLRRIYAQWGAGDYSAGEFLHPEFELTFAPGFLQEGTYNGVAAAWPAWRDWLAEWSSWTYDPVRWIDAGDGRIGVLIDIDGVSRTTGMELLMHGGNLWEFDGELIRRLTLYSHHDDLLRDLGLGSP